MSMQNIVRLGVRGHLGLSGISSNIIIDLLQHLHYKICLMLISCSVVVIADHVTSTSEEGLKGSVLGRNTT